jgi:hypothetical protein
MTTITIGGRAGATTPGIQDAWLLSNFADSNFSTPTSSDQIPFVLRPDLSALPADVTITDAFWTLACTSGGGATTVHFVRVRRVWVEAEVTWNSYSSGNAWGTAGALNTTTDILGADSCVIEYPGGFATGDFTSTSNSTLISDIQGFVDGTITDLSWRVDAGTAAFGLQANATAANRPLLTIVYSEAGAGGAATIVASMGL